MLGFGTILAIYFLIWWVVLFAVLPFGVRNQEEGGEVARGTDPGAPAVHTLWGKLLWTTIIASVVFVILWAIYASGIIPMDALMNKFGPPSQHH